MAIAGQTPLRFMGLVPGALKPTISISVLWILPQTLIMSGGSVSPSAVWYTSFTSSVADICIWDEGLYGDSDWIVENGQKQFRHILDQLLVQL